MKIKIFLLGSIKKMNKDIYNSKNDVNFFKSLIDKKQN
jgi:hypothetical protein